MKIFSKLLVCSGLSLFLVSAFSQYGYKVYSEPKESAKVAFISNFEQGLTIYHNKWVKVKDHKTGDFGWIQREEANKIASQNNVSLEKKVATNNHFSMSTEYYKENSDDMMKDFAQSLDKLSEQDRKKIEEMMKMSTTFFKDIMHDIPSNTVRVENTVAQKDKAAIEEKASYPARQSFWQTILSITNN